MNQKQFNRYLERDGGCIHCGAVDVAVPHHRLNRGMGGSKQRDVPSNIVVLCSYLNGLLESHSMYANRARSYGWKLSAGDDPLSTPVWYPMIGVWAMLDDEFRANITADVPRSNGTASMYF